jgi:hypothetical protein
MGYREILLTLGAITIFSITTVSVSSHMVNNTEIIYENQATYLLYSYANSIIQQAKTREFDESTINSAVTDPSGFSLGKVVAESYPVNLDDVDDYHNLTTTINDEAIGPVSISVTMMFVDDSDLETAAGAETFYKRMVVTATNSYVSQPVQAVYIFAYQRNF